MLNADRPDAAGPKAAGLNAAGLNAAGLNAAGPNPAGPNAVDDTSAAPATLTQRLLRDLRPLDQVRTIKVKLGLLVAASVGVSSLLLWFGLTELGLMPRYSVPVSILLALVVTQVLAHGMTSPLRELTAAARAMAAGDYSRRVRATSRDEVGEAARAFNRMAEDLGAVDRQRRELVANVSHELRTPVAALQAVLENLVDGITPPDAATLATTLEQTQRLSRLVNELLELSRVDAGIVSLHAEPIDVRDVLAAAVREAKMTGRPVQYAVNVHPDVQGWGDPARLRQLVANLLDNAAKHSPVGGTITVTASTTNTTTANGLAADAQPRAGWRLEVADEGPGIAPADREAVFDRFARGTSAPASDGGTGLGLAIARWVVELHSGSIGVHGAPPGCRIRVDLPGDPDLPARMQQADPPDRVRSADPPG